MSTHNQQTIRQLILGASFMVGSGLSGAAFADKPSLWSIKAFGVFGSANESFGVDQIDGNRIEVGGHGIIGIGGAIEYRLSPLIGLEAAVSHSVTPDFDYVQPGTNIENSEGPTYTPVEFGLNFHLLNTDKLDVHIGPKIAAISYGDFEFELDGQRHNFTVDSEFGWGVSAGIDYQIGNGPLSLSAQMTYMDVEMNVKDMEANTTETLEFNPVTANLGIRYQF